MNDDSVKAALVGVELANPRVDTAAREANFTNEAGVEGTVRFLRNVMGLWLLQESLAAWRRTGHDPDLAGLLEEAAALPSGGPTVDVVHVVHVVGGGARIALLCQLLADACGRPVLAGPVEATALGNVLVQARTAGVLRGDRFVLRDLVRRTQTVRRYPPR